MFAGGIYNPRSVSAKAVEQTTRDSSYSEGDAMLPAILVRVGALQMKAAADTESPMVYGPGMNTSCGTCSGDYDSQATREESRRTAHVQRVGQRSRSHADDR
jgi:hypothetical protein